MSNLTHKTQKVLHQIFEHYYRRQNFYRSKKGLITVVSLASLFFWVFAFKSAVIDANNIPSGSMIPTLKVGDFLFVNKMRYTLNLPFPEFSLGPLKIKTVKLFRIATPQRGDIVTFTPPARIEFENKTLVKRVVGIPGDKIRVKDDEIFVNGVAYPVKEIENKEILRDSPHSPASQYALFSEEIIDPVSKKLIREHKILKSLQYFDPSMRSPERSYEVPAGHYMVMGDNRDNSDDSRRWNFVPLEDIHGKVFMSYFSVNWGSAKSGNDSISDENPIFLFFDWLTGKREGVSVRWGSVGSRIY